MYVGCEDCMGLPARPCQDFKRMPLALTSKVAGPLGGSCARLLSCASWRSILYNSMGKEWGDLAMIPFSS